jgi:L-malate glycosyltransferase
MKTVLVVPGFLADTYSEIEASFVELCAQTKDVRFVWLVPSIGGRYTRFCDAGKRAMLEEPVFVPLLRANNIPYVVADIDKYNPVKNVMLFAQLFREHAIDAVYTHFGYERFWATFFGKLFGKRTIWNEHWHSLGTRHAAAKRWFYRIFVDDFIAVSQFIARTLPRTRGKTYALHNAIRPLPPDDASEGACPVETGGRTLVLMVAAFRAEKRHDLALEICAEVLRTRRDVMFVFLGDGVCRTAFIAEVERRGLADSIRAPGHVTNVDAYYRHADVCMLTSHNEPFGYCVLEAMKFGLPIITFAGGGPAEILRADETGIVVPEADVVDFAAQLVGLIRSPERRRRIGRRARRAVERDFSRDRWVESMGEIVKNILQDDTHRVPESAARSVTISKSI